MKIRKYPSDFIFEFDTLDELRIFDQSYTTNTRSEILKKIATNLGINEGRIKRNKNDAIQEGESKFHPKNYDIEFKDVSFGYEDYSVVRNVSFTAKQGRGNGAHRGIRKWKDYSYKACRKILGY